MSEPLATVPFAEPFSSFTGRAAALHRALDDLLDQSPELEAAAVVTVDGLPMASALPAHFDEDRVAAMSAALLSLGERAADGLGRGGLSQVAIEGESGSVFLVAAGEDAVLVAVAPAGAKTGLVLYEAKRAANAIADVLEAPHAPAAHAVPAPVPVQPPAAVSYEVPSVVPYESVMPMTPPRWPS